MTTHRIRLTAEFEGRADFTMAGIAVLLGISLRELFDLIGETWDTNDLPPELMKLGRQRASEARAHSGSEHPVDAVNFWAVRKWGSRVSLTYDTDAAELWLTTEDAEAARFVIGAVSE